MRRYAGSTGRTAQGECFDDSVWTMRKRRTLFHAVMWMYIDWNKGIGSGVCNGTGLTSPRQGFRCLQGPLARQERRVPARSPQER